MEQGRQPSPRADWAHLKRDRRGVTSAEYAVLFVVLLIGLLVVWIRLDARVQHHVAKGTTQFRDYLTRGKETANEP